MEINNTIDVLDTRNVLERIEELEAEKDSLDSLELVDWYETEEGQELLLLRKLIEACDEYSCEVSSGTTLVRESYFEEYAETLAIDVGYLGDGTNPLYSHINWKSFARELRQDYSRITFNGVTYWIRNT